MHHARCPVVVARDRELAELRALVTSTREGRGGFAAVTGESGIGKSCLVRATADEARSRGLSVVHGRTAASNVPAAYRALSEIVHAVTRGRTVDEALVDRHGAALALLAPGLCRADIEAGAPLPVQIGEAVFAIIDRFGGRHGTLVVLEDLQFAGHETLDVVRYLVDQLAGSPSPTAMIVTVGTDELSPGLELVHDAAGRRAGRMIGLERFDVDAVEQFVRTTLETPSVPPDLVEFLHAGSSGVPFLLEELLDACVRAGTIERVDERWQMRAASREVVPESIVTLVERRLTRLSAPSRSLVQFAAVAGERFDWRYVSTAAALTEESAIAALDEAAALRLVEEEPGCPGTYAFAHGLARPAVLRTLSGPKQELIARLLLDALDGGQETTVDLSVEARQRRAELVAELAVTGRDPRAVPLLIGLTRRAIVDGACTSARRFGGIAASLAQSESELADALDALLEAHVAAGDSASAADTGRRLLEVQNERDADAVSRARTHRRLGASAANAHDWAVAERHIRQALELAVPDAADRVHHELLSAEIALGRGRPSAAISHAMVARELADDERTIAASSMLLGRARRVVDIAAATADFDIAVEAAAASGSLLLLAQAMHERATLDVVQAGSAERLQAARDLADRAGGLALRASVDHDLAIVHWLRGDLGLAVQAAARACDARDRYGMASRVDVSLAMGALCAAVRGDRTRTVALVGELLDGGIPTELVASLRGHALALAALSCEDLDVAISELDLAAALVPAWSEVARAPHAGMRALLYAVHLDDDHAAKLLSGDPAVAGVAHHLCELAEAVAAGRRGDRAVAAHRAEVAIRSLDPTPWFAAIARRHTAVAALRDGWGSPSLWLRDAIAHFDQHGLHDPADACRRHLRALGVNMPRRRHLSGRPELERLGVTIRENEVLELLAAGRTNRSIATHLMVSVRTVEKHVERLMYKTGSTNRTQLAAVLHR